MHKEKIEDISQKSLDRIISKESYDHVLFSLSLGLVQETMNNIYLLDKKLTIYANKKKLPLFTSLEDAISAPDELKDAYSTFYQKKNIRELLLTIALHGSQALALIENNEQIKNKFLTEDERQKQTGRYEKIKNRIIRLIVLSATEYPDADVWHYEEKQ